MCHFACQVRKFSNGSFWYPTDRHAPPASFRLRWIRLAKAVIRFSNDTDAHLFIQIKQVIKSQGCVRVRQSLRHGCRALNKTNAATIVEGRQRLFLGTSKSMGVRWGQEPTAETIVVQTRQCARTAHHITHRALHASVHPVLQHPLGPFGPLAVRFVSIGARPSLEPSQLNDLGPTPRGRSSALQNLSDDQWNCGLLSHTPSTISEDDATTFPAIQCMSRNPSLI